MPLFNNYHEKLSSLYPFPFSEEFFTFKNWLMTLTDFPFADFDDNPLRLILGDVFVVGSEDFDPETFEQNRLDKTERFSKLPNNYVILFYGEMDGLNIGYVFNEGKGIYVAENYASEDKSLTPIAPNLVEAFRYHLEEVYAGNVENITDDPEYIQDYQESNRQIDLIRNSLENTFKLNRPEVGEAYWEKYDFNLPTD